MIKNTFKVLATLALPVLFAAGCGGVGDIFGTDGGSNDVCPAGTTLYAVGATYTNVVVSQITDGCGSGLTPTSPNLTAARNVVYDKTSGIVTVTSMANGTLLGSGPVKCNTGTLTYGPMNLDDGDCNWVTTRTLDFKATGDYNLTLSLTDDHTSIKTSTMAGASCKQPTPSCTNKFTLTMTK